MEEPIPTGTKVPLHKNVTFYGILYRTRNKAITFASGSEAVPLAILTPQPLLDSKISGMQVKIANGTASDPEANVIALFLVRYKIP